MKKKSLLVCTLILMLLLSTAAQAAMPKPGDVRPGAEAKTDSDKKTSLQIKMSASLMFPTAKSSAKAAIENPADSGMDLSYRLIIDADVLSKVTGIPHDGPLTVFEYDALPPGGKIDSIRLNTVLPQGTYSAYMMIDPVYEDGAMVGSNFRVENSVQIMVDEREAETTEDGRLGSRAHNGGARAAVHELVISASEIMEKAGINVYDEGCGFKPEDTFFRLFYTDTIPGYQDGEWKQVALPDGSQLPDGEYTCWLIRKVDGQEPYGCAKVTVYIVAQTKTLGPDTMTMNSEMRLQYAQAVVNAQYLLDLEEAN